MIRFHRTSTTTKLIEEPCWFCHSYSNTWSILEAREQEAAMCRQNNRFFKESYKSWNWETSTVLHLLESINQKLFSDSSLSRARISHKLPGYPHHGTHKLPDQSTNGYRREPRPEPFAPWCRKLQEFHHGGWYLLPRTSPYLADSCKFVCKTPSLPFQKGFCACTWFF